MLLFGFTVKKDQKESQHIVASKGKGEPSFPMPSWRSKSFYPGLRWIHSLRRACPASKGTRLAVANFDLSTKPCRAATARLLIS